MAGWITVVIMACCILMGLVLLWWKSRGVAETIDSGTQASGRGQMFSRRTYENHGHEARQGRALHKRLPIHFEIPCGSVRVGVLIAIHTTLQTSALGGALGYDDKF